MIAFTLFLDRATPGRSASLLYSKVIQWNSKDDVIKSGDFIAFLLRKDNFPSLSLLGDMPGNKFGRSSGTCPPLGSKKKSKEVFLGLIPAKLDTSTSVSDHNCLG